MRKPLFQLVLVWVAGLGAAGLVGCSSDSSDATDTTTPGGSGGEAGQAGSGNAGQGGSANAGSAGKGGAAAGAAGKGGAGMGGAGASGAGTGGAGQAGGGAGGSTQAGSGGTTQAGQGGTTQAGSGGDTQAGNGGTTQAGNGGTTQAGQGGMAQAGSGGTAQGGAGGCTGGTTVTSFDDFIDKLAALACNDQAAGKCGAFDMSWCVAETKPYLASFFAHAQANFDATLASECLGATCGGSVATDVDCQKLFNGSGTKKPGETCVTPADCEVPDSGSISCAEFGIMEAAGTRTTQICQVRKDGKLGDACQADSSKAVAVLVTCRTEDGLVCKDKTCQALPAVGDPCNFGSDCASGRCVQGNNDQGTCTDPAAAGESCQVDSDCVATTFCQAGTCTALKKNGESCADVSSRSPCVSGLCAYGQCVDPLTCSEPAYPSDAAKQFEQDFLTTTCTQVAGCCTSAGLTSTAAFCSYLEGAFRPQPHGGLVFDSTAAAACLDATKNGACGLGFSFGDDAVPDKENPCGRVYTTGKNAPPGGACDSAADCAPADAGQASCQAGAGGGTCVVSKPGKLGDSCAAVDSVQTVCRPKDGLTCDGQSGKCVALGGSDAPCFFDGMCLATHLCDSTTNKCVARPKLGEVCTTPTSCFDGYCANGTCVTLVANGSACTYNEQCQSGSCSGSLCVANIGFAALFCQ